LWYVGAWVGPRGELNERGASVFKRTKLLAGLFDRIRAPAIQRGGESSILASGPRAVEVAAVNPRVASCTAKLFGARAIEDGILEHLRRCLTTRDLHDRPSDGRAVR